MRFLFPYLLISLVFFACSPEEESEANAPISVVPEIKIEKVYPTSINQFESIFFEIRYTDGDGDLGTEDADDHSLQILDTRDSILHTFHVAPLSPGGVIAITGILNVELENVILLDQANDSETITFKVRLTDRGGNWSETVNSPEVSVKK